MHGRNRAEFTARMAKPEVIQQMNKKVDNYHTLKIALIGRRQSPSTPESSTETLSFLSKLLPINPDYYSLWNHRREVIQDTLLPLNTKTCELELKLTEQCLRKNPKCYGAWFHRKWTLQQLSGSDIRMDLLKNEIAMTSNFLLLDERNFHCWNFRRFVVYLLVGGDGGGGGGDFAAAFSKQVATPPPPPPTTIAATATIDAIIQSEFEFTRDKIDTNFSNYSAFHYRSKLLPLILNSKSKSKSNSNSKLEIAREELQICQSAVFTEPADQSAWIYFRFVLDWAKPPLPHKLSNKEVRDYVDLLSEQMIPLKELIEDENAENKWSLLCLHNILSTLHVLVGDLDDDAKKLVRLVMLVDPAKKARYSRILMK